MERKGRKEKAVQNGVMAAVTAWEGQAAFRLGTVEEAKMLRDETTDQTIEENEYAK